MRLFYFLIFISFYSHAQTCTQANFPANGGTVNCTTLTINSAVNYSLPYGSLSSPVEFIVSGDVTINADIILDGDNGITIIADNTDGASGGPGAGDGGGIALTTEMGGSDGPPYSGAASSNDGVCNHGGGGGGGVSSAGQNGVQCPSGTITTPGDGGLILTTAEFDFPTPFRGGYGGGAGGAKPLGAGVFDAGSGGGGGGAIHIQAGGKIIIAPGVKISARGGNGGNTVNIGGGGGGGSGGAIWLEATLGIENRGILDVRGGTGGRKTNGTLGNGGNGGDGIYRLNSAGVITDGTGTTAPLSSSSKLTSGISCGSLNDDEQKNIFFSMSFGFFLIGIFKILFRSPKRA